MGTRFSYQPHNYLPSMGILMVQQTEYLKLSKLDPVVTDTLTGGVVGFKARGVYFYTIFENRIQM